MARKKRRRRKKKTLIPALLIAVTGIIGCVLIVSGVLLLNGRSDKAVPITQMEVKSYDITITDSSEEAVFPNGVSLLGVSLEGKTLAEARSIAEEYVQSRKDRAVTFSVFSADMFYYNGEMLGVSWTNESVMDELEATLTASNFVEQYKNQKDYEQNPVDFSIELSCDEEYLRQQVALICSYYVCEPTNAVCQLVDGYMSVTPGTVGISFDEESIVQECLSRINDYSSTELVTYDFPYIQTQPEYGTDVFSFEWTVLGEYSTDSLGGGNRQHNITLSAQNMNGTILYSGQEAGAVSDLYGDVSEAGGYLAAATYNQGKQEDDISGGICQTTTTLYNALLLAEMEIVSRSQHSMMVSYVPPSMDAMVNTAGTDFIFKNSSAYPIYIESYVWDDTLVVRIWGKEERAANRTISFETEILELSWEDPLYNEYEDDSVATYGLVSVDQKVVALVETHPYVHSRSYKCVYIDGVLQSRDLLTDDTYKSMKGELYYASDCLVESIQINSPGVFKYLGDGWDIYHEVTFLNGEPWNPDAAEDNY